MKPGRRIADPAAKSLAGTFRKDRHASIAKLATPPADIPVIPPYLSVAAREIWKEELPRVVVCGVVEADSSTFARYCEMEAAFRVQIVAGEVPTASMSTELRRYAELLGIGGPRSRLARSTKPETGAPSPFTTL